MASLGSIRCASVGLLVALSAGALAAPALAQPQYGAEPQYDSGYRGQDQAQPQRPSWDWRGGGAEDQRAYRLVGPGVELLIPELRDTRRGQAFVLRNFDYAHDGIITPREAQAANRAFLDIAGPNRSRFDWDRYAQGYGGRGERGYGQDAPPRDVAPPPLPPREDAPQPRAYADNDDRQPMRDYHFRQNAYGAVFTLQDVLFQTGSAQLREGAEARLLPLARYLKANPRVQVRIDGYTDSVGSAASNITLSRNRARSVADILSAAGVDPARLQLDGHGETTPVATNATPAGRQLNRRVEVTLVGQQASTFQ